MGNTSWRTDRRRSVRTPRRFWLIPVDGSKPRQLTWPPQNSMDLLPRFSPDGRRLAFHRVSSRNISGLHVIALKTDFSTDPAKPPRLLTQLNQGMNGLAWAPDGGSVIFASAP